MVEVLLLDDKGVHRGGRELCGPPRPEDDALAAAEPAGVQLCWVNVVAATPDELTWLAERFLFDALSIEDVAHRNQRAKVELFDRYLFFVMHALKGTTRADLDTYELQAFLGPRLLVTATDEVAPAVQALWQRCDHDPLLLTVGADLLLHHICDVAVDGAFAVLELLDAEVELVQDDIFANRSDGQTIPRLFALKSALVVARKAVSPAREVFNALAHRSETLVSTRAALYFRDVLDHLTRLYEIIDSARDVVASALDAYHSMVAQRTNEQMKKLTVLSSIFLPITAITGAFGMNLDMLPVHGYAPLYVALGMLLVLPAGMYVLVRRLHWF